jgi:hypothetical protein
MHSASGMHNSGALAQNYRQAERPTLLLCTLVLWRRTLSFTGQLEPITLVRPLKPRGYLVLEAFVASNQLCRPPSDLLHSELEATWHLS